MRMSQAKSSSTKLIKGKLVKVRAVNDPTPERPYLIPTSSYGDGKFDINGSSIVRIIRRTEPHYEGQVYINPKYDESQGTSIRLVNPVKVDKNGKRIGDNGKSVHGILKFHKKEIDKVYLIKKAPLVVKTLGEIIMETFVVRNRDQFTNLMNVIMEGVSEIAVKFFGKKLGREMELHWILLCTRDTIIPIDMFQLQNLPGVWSELKAKLFENSSIIKIFHDLRSEADYLLQKVKVNGESIELKNVFDTQMAVYFMDTRQRIYEKREINPDKKDKLPKLTVSLKRFINHIIWDREILYLNMIESKYIEDGTFAIRPQPEKKSLKSMALSVKYLIMLKAILMNELLKSYNTAMTNMLELVKGTTQPIEFDGENYNSMYSEKVPDSIRESVESLSISLNVEETGEGK